MTVGFVDEIEHQVGEIKEGRGMSSGVYSIGRGGELRLGPRGESPSASAHIFIIIARQHRERSITYPTYPT